VGKETRVGVEATAPKARIRFYVAISRRATKSDLFSHCLTQVTLYYPILRASVELLVYFFTHS